MGLGVLLLQLWLLGTVQPPLQIIRSPLRPLRCRWRSQLGLWRLRRWQVRRRGCCRLFAEPAALGARLLHVPANNGCVSAPSSHANNYCSIGTAMPALAQKWHALTHPGFALHSPCLAQFAQAGELSAHGGVCSTGVGGSAARRRPQQPTSTRPCAMPTAGVSLVRFHHPPARVAQEE